MIRIKKVIDKERYARQIQEYIEECFKRFNINYGFYFNHHIDEETVKLTCYYEDWTIDLEFIDYAAWILGFSRDDILSRNSQILEKRLSKYPFFDYLEEANGLYSRSHYGPEKKYVSEKDIYHFIDALQNGNPTYGWNRNRRFDEKSVLKRLDEEVNHMRVFFPKECHEGKIVNPRFMTVTIVKYEDTELMLRSFFDMVDQLNQLFMKALEEGSLNEEEIKEYNFLSSTLCLMDPVKPSCTLLYDDLMRARKIYKEEVRDSIFDVATIKDVDFWPWRFAEFSSNVELVQKYMNIFPYSKKRMKEYSIYANNFVCEFWWEDTFEELQKYLEDEDDFSEGPEPTILYIKKTDEELDYKGEYAERLAKLCRSKRLGGVKENTGSGPEIIKKIEERFWLLANAEYMYRRLDRKYIPGGEDDV